MSSSCSRCFSSSSWSSSHDISHDIRGILGILGMRSWIFYDLIGSYYTLIGHINREINREKIGKKIGGKKLEINREK
jgi:hypothetical protein